VDKEQARFILQSFRPDGSDCSDPEFAEALKLAHEDLELGQWLTRERTFDAAFAAALSEVKLPVELCKNILTGLAIERGDIPQATDRVDAAMIGALASIEPEPSLRGQILAAMECTPSAEHPRRSVWRRAALPLAAAAGIALAWFVTRQEEPQPGIARNTPLPVEVVETGFIRDVESPRFNPDDLKERKPPCTCCLPRGLANATGIGCREWVIAGKSASLVRFGEGEYGVVHLIIFRREDVGGELPQRQSPTFSQCGNWAVARWADEDRVYCLLGDHSNTTKLARLF
jgi:hypothetical protein